ncbi:AraC family transcriptional regulator [Streptomyces sp. NPDC021020]|uniref:AraC family transcriptional regulator n=1 Tax=Streptomyces sp. NPDC021020 TaxID=3365109 RepID=UPI00379704F5
MLDEMVFRSEDVAVADRFDLWHDLMSSTHAPMDLTSDSAADFRGTLRLMDLGGITLWPASFPQLTFHRTPSRIRQSDPETVNLSLVVHGDALTHWPDRPQRAIRVGDFHMNVSSVPMDVCGFGPWIEMIGVEVPRSSLSLPWDRVRDVLGRDLQGRTGIGALVAQFLTQVTSHTGDYRQADAPRLGRVLADLVSAQFAQVLDAEDGLPPETRTRSLTLELMAFIRRHLADTDLTPSSVAAARHISRSHLHRLFQAQGTTVAAYIREQRLEGARRELADGAGEIPVHAIAARWGFKDHATFTRSFRAAYGVAPRDFRHAAHLLPDPAGR